VEFNIPTAALNGRLAKCHANSVPKPLAAEATNKRQSLLNLTPGRGGPAASAIKTAVASES
jgi:hypothetical protein